MLIERGISKRSESLKASKQIESLSRTNMDPKLWGNLPNELLLKIYESLPIKDFYNLQVVCKEWNEVACKGIIHYNMFGCRFPIFTMPNKR
ncbi:hypothetical protein KC19_7G063500 [Ceratodon purpureus]|uniref:F-box domain-containing protein n=1 Tax=Ceratodon purpureus TaxID=3225 RepID=A0A8T0H570_CERPU|nr:hypothetical protein KC19_7G063500 [Ceratodon purpureus]